MSAQIEITVIGQVASFIMCALYFRKPKNFTLSKSSFIIDKNVLRSTISLGAATFVTQISIVVLSLVCNMTLAHYGELSKYGQDIPISVFSIQTKVYTIVLNIVTGIVLGGQPIFGYNYGAKRMDRVKEAYTIVLRATIITGLIATLIFQLWPELVINIFGSGNELYQEFAVKTFRIYLSLMTVTCLIKMTAVFFQSIGKSIHSVIASIVRDIVCFTPLALILTSALENNEAGNGINGLLYAAPISDVITLVVILILTVSFFKSIKKEEVKEEVNQSVIKTSRPGPIITISREHGSKGKKIGMLVAERLNIPFYYKEMTALAAKESGLDQTFIKDLNDNAPHFLYDLYLSTNVVKQAVIAQEEIIQKIAENGSSVIIGRASDYVLRDNKNVINIFIYANKCYRIKNIMEMYNDSYEEAVSHMKHSDNARSAYYRNITGKRWGDVHNYDLCIDSSIGEDKVVEIICDYIKNKSLGKSS